MVMYEDFVMYLTFSGHVCDRQICLYLCCDSSPLPAAPSGDGSNGGASGRAALLLGPGQGLPAGRRGPELHPPPADGAVQRLPVEKQRGPHHLPLLLRAPGEPGEAAAGRKWSNAHFFSVIKVTVYDGTTANIYIHGQPFISKQVNRAL